MNSEESELIARLRKAAEEAIDALIMAEHAQSYARRLAKSLHDQHYSDVPNWEPLPDTLGLLTQIDNMSSGVCRVTRSSRLSDGEPVAYARPNAIEAMQRGSSLWDTTLTREPSERERTSIPLYTSPSPPPGHVVVPVEPTEAMVEAFMAEMGAQGVAMDDFSEPIYPAKLYRAMLAALPHNQGGAK